MKHLCPPTLLFSLFSLLFFSLPLLAQGTKEDYERANSLSHRVEGLVHRSGIKPNWIAGQFKFWYHVDLGGGKREYLLVDAEKGTKFPAFDHAKLAVALAKISGKPIEADKLPVDSLSFTAPKTILIQIREKSWRCNLRTYELTESKSELGRATPLPPNSAISLQNSADETKISFLNQLTEDVDVFWVDATGKRQRFGSLKPGETREQHTYFGHAWLFAKKSGEPIVAFLATEHPTLAVIDGKTPRRLRKTPDNLEARPSLVSPDKLWKVIVTQAKVSLQSTSDPTKLLVLASNGSKEDAYQDEVFWAPDSKHFMAVQTIPEQEHKVSMVESPPKDQLQPKLFTHSYLKPGDKIAHPRPRLFSLEKQIQVSEALFPNPWEINQYDWESDSKHLLFLYNQRGHQIMRYLRVDVETGEAKAVIDEEAKTFIDWTNKVYLHHIPAAHEAIWMSERDGWNHLYLYDISSGKVKNQITKGSWVVRGIEKVDDVKRQIWFRYSGIDPKQDPYHVHFARVNFDGSGLTRLTEGDGTHSLTYSPDGKTTLDTYSRVDLPPVIELRNADTGKLIREIERADATDFLKAGFSYPERFVSKARDGKTDIWGVIVRPSNFDPAKKYPVLENIYAGPQGSFVPKSFSPSLGMQSIAELGFIVVQIDGLGTNNRSKAFQDVCWKNLGDAGFPDRILWHKAAAAKYPQMDLTRVGIYGTSAGGQNALGGLLTHGDFYKAGMADCGCHDNRMDKIWWNEQWMGWPIGPHYDAQSNVTLAHNLTGKLLLMVGEMDTNVDPASTMQVCNALIKADKDFEFLVVPGWGHGVLGSPYAKRRMQDFFVKNLLGVEPRR